MIGPLIGLLALLALTAWLLRRRRGHASHGEGDVDEAELEAAEREVRDLDSAADPGEGFEGDDWGPGTRRPGSARRP